MLKNAPLLALMQLINQVLAVVHILRERKMEQPQQGNCFENLSNTSIKYWGTSRGMEGIGVKWIAESLKKAGLSIGSVSHDNDSSSMNNIRAVFPDAKEFLDVGHAAKNLKKKVIALAKSHPEIKGFGERVQRDFRSIVKKYLGQPEKIRDAIINMPNHYQRKCTELCLHSADYVPSYKPLTSEETIASLTDTLQPYAERASQFSLGISSNTVESINKMIAMNVPKEKDFKKAYCGGANRAILMKNEGILNRLNVLKKIGLVYSKFTEQRLQQQDKRQQQDKERKRKEQYKEKKRENKLKKKEARSKGN